GTRADGPGDTPLPLLITRRNTPPPPSSHGPSRHPPQLCTRGAPPTRPPAPP
ncbi:hypothetical protein IscW_ISCW008862, partial [Ixodes scapularis]